ncbi:MAG: HEPN domain-containing protein, partial [Clostridiales bacterium]|nr:HEPN domain-containing protein [Clostridiales bacterium]
MGYNDYLFAKHSINAAKEIGNYNGVASMASQSAEKLLKAVIERYFADDEDCIPLMKSHNLRSLLEKIKTRFPDCPLDSKDYKWLGDFYYDARYPGDNFITVGEESGLECIRLLDELLLWIDTLEEPTKKKPLGLGKIEDFIETEHKD